MSFSHIVYIYNGQPPPIVALLFAGNRFLINVGVTYPGMIYGAQTLNECLFNRLHVAERYGGFVMKPLAYLRTYNFVNQRSDIFRGVLF